ncbi:MAG TPA: alpha/beta fold hydrolase [Tahibacter sp.]|nr:alpha/beta fold hydrolase [Tahibacter sp.]
MRLRFASFVLVAVCAFASPAHAADAKPAFTQDTARGIIGASRKIVSGHGIETLQAIDIDGTKQWISVRGNDARNPILLFLHGGPASPDMPLAYTFQTPWEDYFTVVQWDQRGAGKTYAANDPAKIGPTMSIGRLTDDAAAVVEYVRRTYGKRKIFLLGHSWGSVLGVRLASAHPDWFYAYIGVGQIVNMRESEAIGYRFALDQARARGNAAALKELEAIAPYPAPGKPLELATINLQRKWLQQYGGLAWGRTGFEYDSNAEKLAPEYSNADLAAIDQGSLFTMKYLLGPLTDVDFTKTTKFDLPILLFVGRHDYSVSHELTARWFRTLDAPAKKLVWFEDSAHMIMQEQPGRFLEHLVDDARPYAVEAGDAAPGEAIER